MISMTAFFKVTGNSMLLIVLKFSEHISLSLIKGRVCTHVFQTSPSVTTFYERHFQRTLYNGR
jgi:hypothetical protein